MRRCLVLVLCFSVTAPCRTQQPVYTPLACGTRVKIFRGNDTPPSHVDEWNRYAFDYSVPIGTPVLAAASGTVVALKQDTEGPTGNPHDNNFIAILQDDGFAGLYEHLKKDGAAVVVGQKILAGDVIGWSGNTGWSEAPHLHFVLRTWNGVLGPSVPCRFADFEGGGVPKTNDLVLSRNFPIREIVGDLANLTDLYELCAAADAREALASELTRVVKEKPEVARRKCAAVKERPDLQTVYDGWRATLVERLNRDVTAAVEEVMNLRAVGTHDAIVRSASLALRDFAFSEKAPLFEEILKAQKAPVQANGPGSELEAVLKYRTSVTLAVRAELKLRGLTAAAQPAAAGPVKLLFEAAVKLAPTTESSAALTAHLKSPIFRAPSPAPTKN